MTRVKELRISFVCPVQDQITLAASVDHIEKGAAFVACPVCKQFHRIEPVNQEEATSLSEALDELESSLDDLRSVADDAESAATGIQGHVTDAENRLNDLRSALASKAAA